MSVHSSTISPRRIDKNRPLHLDHPLLRGLEGFWLPLPHLAGGSRLYDLSGYGRHGTLTNMDPSTDWVSEPEAGTGVFLNDSVNNEHIDFGDILSDIWVGGGTFFFYFIPTTYGEGGFGRLFYKQKSGQSGANDLTYQTWLRNDSTVQNGVQFHHSDSSGSNSNRWNIEDCIFLDTPHTLIISYNSDNWASATPTVTVDGVEQSLTQDSNDDGSPASVEGGSLAFGIRDGWGDREFQGKVFAAGAVGRELSTSEHGSLDEQIQRGFPDLLRTRTTVYPLSGTGGGTSVSESLSVAITTTPNLVETAQVTESASVPITAAPALVESAAASETASVAIATTPSITETAAVNEVVAVGTTATPSVTETASVSETISVGVQATVSIVETVGTAVFESISVPITGSPSVAESASASESVSAQATATPTLSESASASEALSAAVQASPKITESASATEQIQVTAQAAVSLIETATVTEAIQIGIAATISITETVGEIAGRRLSEVGKNAVRLLTRSQNEAEKQ